MPLKVLTVAEGPELEALARMLRDHGQVEHVDVAASRADALRLVGERTYDATFVDVAQPALGGVELARVLRRFASPPRLVFVSAHDAAAVQAFELQAVDYLLRPVSSGRLDETIRRLLAHGAGTALPAAGVLGLPQDGTDLVPVDAPRGGTRLLPRASILYLQSHGDYVRIVADDGRFLLRAPLSYVERRWAPYGFVRVHRRFLVQLRRAVELRPLLNGTAVLVFPDRSQVPVARRQVAQLRQRLRA